MQPNSNCLLEQVSWGVDLASEHERYLTEEVFQQPVIVYNYPKEIKVRLAIRVLYFLSCDSGGSVSLSSMKANVGQILPFPKHCVVFSNRKSQGI